MVLTTPTMRAERCSCSYLISDNYLLNTLDHWAIGTAPSCSKIVLTECTPSRTELAEMGLYSYLISDKYLCNTLDHWAIGTAHSCSKIVLTEYTLSRTESAEMGLPNPTMRAERCSCRYLISDKYLCNTLDHSAIRTSHSCSKIVLTEYPPSRTESPEMGLTSATMRAERCSCRY